MHQRNTAKAVIAIIIGFVLSCALPVHAQRIPKAVTPSDLLLDSDLICLGRVEIPSLPYADGYATQFRVESVIASVGAEPWPGFNSRSPTNVSHISIITPRPGFHTPFVSFLDGGAYLLLLKRAGVSNTTEVQAPPVVLNKPDGTRENIIAFKFNLETNRVYSPVSGPSGVIVLNNDFVTKKFGTDLYPFQPARLLEVFGTSDVASVKMIVTQLAGALRSNDSANSMARLAQSTNSFLAGIASKWPASAVKKRFNCCDNQE